MKYFSTFSGIGGFEVGIQNAFKATRLLQGIDHLDSKAPDGRSLSTEPLCVGYSEIDKYASSVYKYHFKGAENYGDITKIYAEELPEFDCLVGGFPCQAFSVAGKRRGFEDTRGTLFFELARILKAKTPRLFVFENVKGLLSHDNGNTFKTIIAAIDELGYDCQWQVLNSKNHGVPQNRERIIIVGHFRGTPRPEVFPITGDIGENTQPCADEQQGPQTVATRHLGRNGRLTSDISPTIQVAEVPHLISKTVRTGGRSSPHGSKQNWDSYEVDGRIRRLTPLECERLQGFPDNWTARGEATSFLKVWDEISDSQRYKMCGNAVTTNVIQAVFERILATH